METKSDGILISRVSRSLGFAFNVACDTRGLLRGLTLFWDGSISLSVYHSSSNFFACNIKDVTKGHIYEWKVFLLYESPDLKSRHEVWEDVVAVVSNNKGCFIICGDLKSFRDGKSFQNGE